MRAIVYSEYGPADVLHVKDVARPEPRDNEVLIKVQAVEATKSDCEMRSFDFQVSWFWLPLRFAFGFFKPKKNKQILGGYFAGTVESVGKDVTKYNPGDEIFGCTQLKLGAYGEYMCLPDDFTMVPKPENLSFEQAAAVPLGGLNAIHFMRKANIQHGDKVLVNGAGASIGTFGVQIAKAMGAEVTAVDSDIKEQMLRSIGADHFFDYAKQHFAESGIRYDVIFSMVAKSSFSDCIRSLNPGGRYVLANPKIQDMLRSVLTSVFSDKKVYFAFAKETEEELLALKQMIEQGEISPVVDKVYPMQQAADAHRRVETEQRLGTIVISMER